MSEEGKEVGLIQVFSLKRVYYGPRRNRADKAIRLIRKQASRIFKDAEKILIHPSLNEYVWMRSREKPPRRVVVELRYNKEEKTLKILLANPKRVLRGGKSK
jgi:large subunit ribosomal protein L31e